MKKTILIFFASLLTAFIVGCTSSNTNDFYGTSWYIPSVQQNNNFFNESYIWENWEYSTNRVDTVK